jgi:aminoglycoside 6'-N-acetyltransferase
VAEYQFRRMTPADLKLVNTWVRQPHVAEWWSEKDDADAFDADVFTEADFNTWIVSLDNHPFAFLQDYNPHLYPDHHFFDRPAGTRGIDQIIGEADMINLGHGTAFIRQHTEALFAAGAPCVVTDPNPKNARAIRAYEKAGFVAFGEVISPEWGPSLLMQRVKS